MILYKEKKDCCGCGACANACPADAISMTADEYGFLYPEINSELCLECGLCLEACGFQNPGKWGRSPIAAYAAVNRDDAVLELSASGGAFGALAKMVLGRGGRVYGCAYDGDMTAFHKGIDGIDGLSELQGSKYVQSEMGRVFADAAEYLSRGQWVLFTGTPCQIAGLRAFLGENPERLITADLVCYGVPSPAFFKAQVETLEKELGGRVTDFRFRDKDNGWDSMKAKVVYDKGGEVLETSIEAKDLVYYDLFNRADILRESCYVCPFASGIRTGDFTIGDFWGIEKFHPEVDTEKGVSVLLANSEKALSLMGEVEKEMLLVESDFKKASHENGQLRRPVAFGSRRSKVLSAWTSGGWKAVEDAISGDESF
ncbi:MAG: Coenzyme F420 hydrogenase/dehydrogenase, beta subunit C-terminal domain [Peptostreptococcaceae bacterium]|nr:Coenzyme F420 hydrogenase/dehydrogenase, beta subunit C-terminal domain [Peptostreptococcaceae bacterium]